MTELGAPQGSLRLTASHLVLHWAEQTDTGNVRPRNEDSIVANGIVFAIADGMGGHAAGDVASDAVVGALSNVDQPVEPESIYDALVIASDSIEQKTKGYPSGCGTTVTGFGLADPQSAEPSLLVFNIGDSRTYGYTDGRLHQLTVDHSVVQELIDAGKLDPAEAENHPAKNQVTRAVGFGDDPVPDYWGLPVFDGLTVLVCSDGLVKEVAHADIERALSSSTDPSAIAQLLVRQALARGGRDNVSVIVATFAADSPVFENH